MPLFPGAAVAAGATAAATGFAAWAVRGRASAVFAPSIWRGPRDRRAVALTFDDGPCESTARILEVLARYNVRATFFQCGANVERMPAVAREVAAAGHEIGNHTHTHPMLPFRPTASIEDEISRAQRAIEIHTGVTPRWFRAPFGVRWFGLRRAQGRFGLTGVMWTVIGYDWNRKADAIFERVIRGVSNGAIICLHDGRELQSAPDTTETVEAVNRLVPLLLDRGYELRTISQLICPTISLNAY
jgi:peptidoglycan/xylan/chitin deacetylase (PgdA/CDA1 family)